MVQTKDFQTKLLSHHSLQKPCNMVMKLSKMLIKEKQSSRGVLMKGFSENMQQIYRRTPIPKCVFNKVALQIYWNHTSAWVFSCKFLAYFQNTLSLEHISFPEIYLSLRGDLLEVSINSTIFATFTFFFPALLCHNLDSSMLKSEGSLSYLL